jgi:phosphoribosylaminoimidazole carboxylase (NCAIR synthetase)
MMAIASKSLDISLVVQTGNSNDPAVLMTEKFILGEVSDAIAWEHPSLD